VSLAGILFAMGLVGVVGGFWQQVCNERTYRDRRRIAERLFQQPDWQVRRALFQQVSYSEHLRYRFFLLDPWKLYHPKVTEGLRDARG
jgi:hypothetical protein